MNIKGFSKQITAHGRALNMPAGTSFAPFGIPLGFTGFCSLPKCKVRRILLGFLNSNALPGLQFVDFLAGQGAVGFKFTNGEIDVTILVLIGIALFFELLDQGKHLRNVLSRSRLNARRQAAEFTEIFLHTLGIGLGQFGRQNLAFSRTFNNLVVNIGYVADEFDVVAALLEPASCHVKSDKCSSVSNVAVIVDGNAANIHSDFFGCNGFKGLHATRERIVNF